MRVDQITIFKDNKMYAIRTLGQWYVVEKDCTYCGFCCLTRGKKWHFADEEGRCVYLKEHPDSKALLCGLGASRPFDCSVSDPHCIEEECSMEVRKVEFEELEL